VDRRKVYLLAVAALRAVDELLPDGECRRLVAAIESHVDGLVQWSDLERQRRELARRWRPAYQQWRRGDRFHGAAVHWKAVDLAASGLTHEVLESLTWAFQPFPKRAEHAQAVGVRYVRDIFGNPFRPIKFDLSWRTPRPSASR
jgi:hypothetical protein